MWQECATNTYEYLLEDDDLWGVFVNFAEAFARAEVPATVASALRLGRITAVRKDSGKVRGIVAGSILRRLVCKSVAKQYAGALMAATAPYQFALQTRAGTEALAHILQYVTEKDPTQR